MVGQKPARLAATQIYVDQYKDTTMIAIRKQLLCLTVLIFAAFFVPNASHAADSAAQLDPARAEALADLLSDPAQRDELIGNLRDLATVTDQQEPSPAPKNEIGITGWINSLVARAGEGVATLGQQLAEFAQALSNPGPIIKQVQDEFSDPHQRDVWLGILWKVGLMVLAGIAARFIVRAIFARPRKAIEDRQNPTLLTRVPWLLARTILDVLPIAALGGAAYGTLELVELGTNMATDQAAQTIRDIGIIVIKAIVLARMILAVTRLIATPLAPNLRLIPLEDRTAAYMYVWVSRFVNIGIYGFALVPIMVMAGIPEEAAAGFSRLVGFLLLVLAFIVVLQSRTAISAMIAGTGTILEDDETQDRTPKSESSRTVSLLRARVADIWHVLMLTYVTIFYVIWALSIDGGFSVMLSGTVGTIIVIALAELAVKAAHQGMGRFVRIDPEIEKRFPGLEQRAGRYLSVARIVVTGLICLVAFLAILESWTINVLGALNSEAGAILFAKSGRIILVVFAAILFWEAIRAVIARTLVAQDDQGNTTVRSQRTRTLLPLAQSALTIVISLIAALTILSELGLDIGPLLAGAGVIGLAIGFGAQTLVKDVITGLFILLEDAISVGDVVDVAGHTGTVEAVSVRSVRLRDLSGTVHTVPFSSIDSVKNLTKEFSYYVLNVGVAYRENTDAVIALMREVDEDLRNDPEFGHDILAPLDVLGVNEFADSAVVIRARIKTNPLQQWRVGREYNRRMKFKFDEHNVEIPFPHQTVYFGVDREGKAPPAYITMASAEASTDAAPLDKLAERENEKPKRKDQGDSFTELE